MTIIKINGSINIDNNKITMDNLSIEINEGVNSVNKKEVKNLPREVNKIDYNHIADMVIEESNKEDLQKCIAALLRKAANCNFTDKKQL